jgi:crotonobetainyl-CoA:carnitine CoA-transferase CaiB-like acyl-CoA transferase
MISQVTHADLGTIHMPGFPINSGATNLQASKPAPACGQDTRAVLLGVGYTDDDIAVLRERGAIHCREQAAGIAPRLQPVAQ